MLPRTVEKLSYVVENYLDVRSQNCYRETPNITNIFLASTIFQPLRHPVWFLPLKDAQVAPTVTEESQVKSTNPPQQHLRPEGVVCY